ncbi:MBL fold metallo-hydrolase [Christensenellaceae bacterium NSJ-44]|uniref:MBL fold metallo-hydrolase n=1 Tax=Luoshenia tenuis TaxID=2763654 RepID=A0A926HN32_9FIRM|nr:ComEC/Rec2 family competence protein [Luoshenia tenuis]MBC8529773.1 MBL fold metallo-hydrolase [Luoshenia tenuis]
MRSRFRRPAALAALCLAVCLCLAGCSLSSGAGLPYASASSSPSSAASSPAPVPAAEGALTLHFFDVGQGDATLVTTPAGENILIDGGPRASGQALCGYLDALGIRRLDRVIATHPHEDHIGGLVAVIPRYEIGEVVMPYYPATTKVYRDLLTAIDQKGLSITPAAQGMALGLDSQSAWQVLWPPEDAESAAGDNPNNASVVLRITFGQDAVLLTGDAEKEVEAQLPGELASGLLKVGHHGSSTSTSAAFLKKVAPGFAVIMVGQDNSYNHPNAKVVQRLTQAGAQVLRTDEAGTITLQSQGQGWQRIED